MGLPRWLRRRSRTTTAPSNGSDRPNRARADREITRLPSESAVEIRRLEDRAVLSVDVVDLALFNVAENSSAGTVVGQVQATQTGTADPLAYAITGGNDDGAFSIDAKTGVITVADGTKLDFEAAPLHALTVSATSTLDPTMTDSGTANVQLTDVYAPAAVTLAGGSATLSVVGGNLQVAQGATILFSAPSEDVSSITITGSALADHLTVDFSGGDPIPDGGLSFNGLGPTSAPAGGGDTLSVTGGTFDSVDFRYDNGHDGGIVLAAGGVAQAIEYTGLEPVNDFTVAATKSFTLSASNDGAVLEDLGAGILRLRSTTGTFESTTFTAPTALVEIFGGDGDDTITVTSLTGTFGVNVDGDAGTNTLVVDQVAAPPTAPLFTFAGFTFDQSLTPDQGFNLPTGLVSGGFGVAITAVPTATAGPVNFPESAAGFNAALSLGRLLNPALVSGVLAQRLPLDDNGTTARSGFELAWSGGRTLTNSAGDDLVFYESSDSAGGPDAGMIQVHVVGGGWTKWYYEVKDSRANYVGSPSAGAFATAIDLSDLGLADGTQIDGIRFVNMTAADRMEGPGFERMPGSGVFVSSAGFVIVNDNGATSNVRPDPGATASFAFFGSATLDPDALYVGALHPLAGPPPFQSGNDIVGITSTTVTITTDGTPRPTITYDDFAELQVSTRDGADTFNVTLEAGLPPNIKLDGGNTNESDTVTLIGTTGAHQIQLTGSPFGGGAALVDAAATVHFANIDRLTVDVDTGAGAGDTVTVDGSFRLSGGPEPQLQVLGGTGQNDRLEMLTESPAVTPAPQNYTFAGVTFDQTATPNQFTELGLGTLAGGQGVVVNTRIVDSSPLTSGFPAAPTAGFDASLSIGHLFGRTTGTTVRFVGMPDTTNNGSALRSGFLLTWSGDRALENLGVGNDLVIYESGSAGTPEPTMVQVRDAATGTWSQWVYHPATSQQVTTGGTNVGFASVYDLTDFGIGAAGAIDAVRVVNLIASDRMVSASGIGVVLPGETAPGSTNRPAVGALAVGFTNFGASTLDPDPIYVGALHGTATATASGDVVTINQGRVEVAGWMTITHTNVDHVAVDTGGGADRVTFVDTGPLVGAPIAGNSPAVSLTLLTGTGNDTVTVTSVAADFRPSLTIDGGAGTDLVSINGGLTLGSAVSSGELTVIAERIDVTAPIDTTAGLTGHVHLTAASQINLSAAADITAGGDLTIDGGAVFSTAADLRSVAGDITISDATTLTGNVSLTADVGGIFFTGAAATIDGPFNLGLSAGTDIDFDAAIGGGTDLLDVTITTAVNVNFDSTLDARSLTQLDGTGTTTFNGAATLATAVGGTAVDVRTAVVTVNATVTSTGGELRFFTDVIDIAAAGALNATTAGIVTISGKTAGREISLGTEVPATLALSTAELNRITADVLRVGQATSGNITIGGTVGPTNFDTLHLATGGTVTGAGPITIAELAVEAVGTLDLQGANEVDRLAVLMTGASQVDFNDTDDITIAAVDGVVGLVNPGTTVLTFGAGLTQAAGTDVLTDQLQLNGAGDVTLLNPTNDVRVLAAAVDGRIDIVDVDDIEIGTVNTAGVVSFALTASAVDIFVTAPIDTTGGGAAGEVRLTATNLIDLTAAGDITAGGGVTIDGGAALSTAADIRSLAGDISVSNATTLTGNVVLTADIGGIFFVGAAATVDGPFNLDLSAGTDIGFDGAIGGGTPLVDVTITRAVNVNFFSTLDAATLTQVDGTGTTTFGGAATLTTAAGTALDVRTASVAVLADVASTGGELHFFTDAMEIAVGGSLDATAAGIITITGKTAGQLISLGAEVPATLALSTAELNAVTADIVRIGDASSGNITIDGLVSPVNFDTLHLTTGGTVTGVGAVVIAELAVEAAGTLDLQGANDVDRLAVLMTGVSQVTFTDNDDLSIDTVDGVVGLFNLGTTVLTFGAGLTQAAGADVLTDQLQLSGAGDAVLTNLTNNVRVLAAAVDGRVDYVDIDSVEIGTVTTAGVVSFALTVSAVDIFVTAPIDTTGGLAAGEVHLTATNLIDLTAAGDITAGGSVTIDGGAAFSTAADIRSIAGDIFVTDATTLTGDVTIRADLGGIFFLGAAATIDGAQNLTLAAGGNIGFDAPIGAGTPLLDVLIETAASVGFFDSLDARSLVQLDGTGITFFGGPATLATAVGGTAVDLRTAAVLVNDAVASTGGEIRIFTDQIVITAAGSIDATTAGIVTISGKTAGRAISLGANLPGFLGLSTAELDRITADVLRIGDPTSGNIRIPGLVNPLNTDTLHLTSGGAVFGNGSIVIAELAVEAVGAFTMGNLNDVDRLAVRMTGPSLIAFADANDLVIDTVDGVAGIVNRPGITILAFAGNLTQSATGDIVTGQLGLDGLGDATLLNVGNDVRVLAGFVDGVFQFRDANDLEIGTILGVDGFTTLDSEATIFTGGNLVFSQMLDVGTAGAHLFAGGAIDDAGGGAAKIIAADLELFALAGIGVTNPLETDVDRLAAANGFIGAIRIHDVGGTLSIGAVGVTVGVSNLGGGIEIIHVGRMQVDAPIVELAGDVTLTTVADGGNDDHLVINAPMLIAGGAGSFTLHGGTDLLVNDTGILNDIEVVGSGILTGTADRDVILGNNVRIRSATGAIENIPPQLSNVNGPQVAATGQAFVSFDYGRALELNFRALVDWSDGIVTSYNAATNPSLFNPGTFTADHFYNGNPNVANPAAPITITVTLLGDPRIRFTGYEEITISTQVTVPGTGLQIFVRIDTSPKIAFLGFPDPPTSEEPPAPTAVLANNTLVEGGGGSMLEITADDDRVVILRAVSADGKREGDSVRFPESALDDLEGIFKKLRDGRYRVYLFEPDTQQLRLVIEVYIRDGKPAAPGADVDGLRDRPDGSGLDPVDDGAPISAVGAEPGDIDEGSESNDEAASVEESSSPADAAAVPALFAAADGRWARRVDAALAQFRDRPFGRRRFSRPRNPR